jgi:hypothetical protein
MKTLKSTIAILITMGLILSQQAFSEGVKPNDTLIPPDNYIKSKKQTVNKIERKKVINVKKNKIIRPGPPRPGDPGPDLQAGQVRITTSPTGLITYRATITNRGASDFISGPGLAAGRIALWWITGTGWEGPPELIVADEEITRLNRNQTINLQGTYRPPGWVGWEDGNLRDGECVTGMAVHIDVRVDLDPDIKNDGNPDNDDINYSNNQYQSNLNPVPGYRVLISSGIRCNRGQ